MEQHDVTKGAQVLCQSHWSLNLALIQAAYLGRVTPPFFLSKTGPLPLQAEEMNKGENGNYIPARAWPTTT